MRKKYKILGLMCILASTGLTMFSFSKGETSRRDIIPTGIDNLFGFSKGEISRQDNIHPSNEVAEDIEYMAKTIYAEARGESTEGKIAVGEVIRNRLLSSRWPSSVKEVVLQPYQFSAWNEGDPNRKFLSQDINQTKFVEYIDIAREVLSRHYDKHANGADHYLNIDATRRLRKNRDLPSWVEKLEERAKIGKHTFLA